MAGGWIWHFITWVGKSKGFSLYALVALFILSWKVNVLNDNINKWVKLGFKDAVGK